MSVEEAARIGTSFLGVGSSTLFLLTVFVFWRRPRGLAFAYEVQQCGSLVLSLPCYPRGDTTGFSTSRRAFTRTTTCRVAGRVVLRATGFRDGVTRLLLCCCCCGSGRKWLRIILACLRRGGRRRLLSSVASTLDRETPRIWEAVWVPGINFGKEGCVVD
jgi:hypothetical protein